MFFKTKSGLFSYLYDFSLIIIRILCLILIYNLSEHAKMYVLYDLINMLIKIIVGVFNNEMYKMKISSLYLCK